MKKIMQDKYILGQSISKAIEKIGQEIRLDLSLKPNPNNNNTGKIHGVVTDKNGQVIENALVKIMSSSYEPLMHDITDSNGTYSFLNVPPNTTYNIFAISNGMKLSQSNQVSLGEMQSITVNFTLEEDPALTFAIIAGDVINQNTEKPIQGAVVALFKKEDNNIEDLQGVIYTNEYGQYVFREIEKGEYVVRIGALGYNTVTSDVSISNEGQIVPMTITMVEDPKTSRGTVSGIITDDNNYPIDRADVILYRVEENDKLYPIAFTKTNEAGIYLFANVPEGNYKVKSNQIEIITINVKDPWPYSPNFVNFRIDSFDNYTYLEDMLSRGTLNNEAKLIESSGYVRDIGGPLNGSATININSPIDGDFNLAIRYLSGDKNRPLKLNINDTYIPMPNFPKTDTWDINSAKIFNLIVKLNKGDNTIIFYNDTGEDSPHINHIGLTALPFEESYEVTDAQLFDKAKIEDNIIKNVGKGLGYILLNVDVPTTQNYNFTITYLANQKNNKCNIEVNGIATGDLYTFTPTNSLNISDSIEKNIDLSLNKGLNIIKIYNN